MQTQIGRTNVIDIGERMIPADSIGGGDRNGTIIEHDMRDRKGRMIGGPFDQVVIVKHVKHMRLFVQSQLQRPQTHRVEAVGYRNPASVCGHRVDIHPDDSRQLLIYPHAGYPFEVQVIFQSSKCPDTVEKLFEIKGKRILCGIITEQGLV